ncbi:MAG: phosphoribosylanthranilate isomerase [Hyphomicrobiaceae bacterium]
MTVDIKICGLSDDAGIDAAIGDIASAETRYVGLVFFSKSPRNVNLEQARHLADRARGRAKVVALMVDPDNALIDEVNAQVAPDLLQLHGHEPVERVKEIRQRTSRRIIKAIGVATAEDVESAASYFAPDRAADIILFDAKPPANGELPGGNGLTFDWRVLANAPDWAKGRFMLSGGLTPENVAEAVARTGPAAVDVSSGVETAPGKKSPQLIERFIRAVKTAKQRS